MADNDSEHSSVPSALLHQLSLLPSTGTTCDHCGKWDVSNNNPLKRCKGCAVVVYCDKDCQRAAWPEHKVFCRAKSATSTTDIGGHNADSEESGYAAPLSLVHAVREWRQIHSYTLDVIMHIALHTNGGVEHNLAAPHAMVFTLESVANDSDYSGHVSKAFRILGARISHRDDLVCLREHWREDQVERRRRTLAALRNFTPNTALAGVIPITFMVRGTGAVLHRFTDVDRPLRHSVDAFPDPLTRLAFHDLDLSCRRAIALGIVFVCPNDATQIYPEAGVYSHVGPSRNRKKWKKISKPAVWPDVLEPMMDESPSEFLSGMPLKLVWALFENW
ncbi:hypothetical protein V8D89_003763 [Ganoderma adspersum]